METSKAVLTHAAEVADLLRPDEIDRLRSARPGQRAPDLHAQSLIKANGPRTRLGDAVLQVLAANLATYGANAILRLLTVPEAHRPGREPPCREAFVDLKPSQTAWDPASTKRTIRGPCRVHYRQFADGGVDAWTTGGPPG